ncbi:hypothetical protein GOP47_0029287 [Adiantum capillus-veneris]|nr:hypothetical protein GOP47_0029287 [Adiantum capillus-veneris]
MADEKQRVVVALDWTPNTNHVGFFVAQALGFYDNAGLSVSLLSLDVDNYSSTPASRVASGTASFALTPSETVISHHLPPIDSFRPKLVAVATVLQQDLSAIGKDSYLILDGFLFFGKQPFLVVCCPDTLKSNPMMVRAFLESTGKGFVYATSNTEHAARILTDAMTSSESSDKRKAVESMKYLANGASLDELRAGNAGSILKASDVILEEMFTNAFL